MAKDKTSSILKSAKYGKLATLADVKAFKKNIDKQNTLVSKDVLGLNVLFSGELDGGFEPGFNLVVAKSKSFKTNLGVMMIKEFLDKNPLGVVTYYDCENGASIETFEEYGVDLDRVRYVEIYHVGDLKLKMMENLTSIQDGEKNFFFVDSLAMLPSKFDFEQTVEGDSKDDMKRAKEITAFFRATTSLINRHDVFTYIIGEGYMSMDFIPKLIIAGGEKVEKACDNVLYITRSNIKESDSLVGYTFKVRSYKSRSVKEGSIVPINARWDLGIEKYGGFDEIALSCGIIEKVGLSYVFKSKVTQIEHKTKMKHSGYDSEFWDVVIKESDLNSVIQKMYMLPEKYSATLRADTK